MEATKKEACPLTWPEGWVRTRPQDRKAQPSWKKNATEYRDALVRELERMGTTTLVISSNVPLNLRGNLSAGVEPLDPGVAVYFSRKKKEDFAWQDALDIHDPAPTVERIDAAFRERAKLYHPDSGGDIAMFQALSEHRDNARRWVTRKTRQDFDYVIACDVFKEVRLNIAAIKLTIAAIRQIERCGTSTLLERAFRGFSALPEHAGASNVVAVNA